MVSMIFVGGKLLGGFQDVMALHGRGQLSGMHVFRSRPLLTRLCAPRRRR
jgi:hypothetical protein